MLNLSLRARLVMLLRAPLPLSLCLLLVHALLLGSACKPAFEDEGCVQSSDCFSDEICSLGTCVLDTTPTTPPEVAIVSFASDATSVLAGEQVTLSWELEHPVSASITSDAGDSYDIPADALLEGSTTFEVTQEVTFTLTAQGAEPGDTQSVAVRVMIETPPAILPVIDRFEVTPATIEPGQEVTLSWQLTDVASGELSFNDQRVTLTEAQLETGEFKDYPVNSTSYRLDVVSSDGHTATRTVAVTVQGKPPVISSFTASDSRIAQGDSVTLSWEVAGADSIELVDASGTSIDISDKMILSDMLTLMLSQDRTFTLTARNAYGMVDETVSVTTYAPLVLESFTSDAMYVSAGDDVVLAWNITGNPTSLVITASTDPGMPLDLMGASASMGSLTTSLTEETVYTLTAIDGDGQSVMGMVTVGILPPQPVIVSFEADLTEVAANTDVTFTWQTVNATSLTLTDDQGAMIDLTGKAIDGDAITFPVPATGLYTLTATNLAGQTTLTEQIIVGEPVTVSLMADTQSIVYGEPVLLTWVATNASALVLTSSLGETFDLTGKNLDGDSFEVYPPDPSTTYTLEARGFAGPVSDMVTISVEQPARVQQLTATPDVIAVGAMTTLSWTTTDADAVTLTATDSTGSRTIATSGQVASGSVTDSPTETTTYTLTATHANGSMDSEQVTVTVGNPVSIDSFSADTLQISTGAGESATLSFTTSNAVQIDLFDSVTGQLTYTDLGNGAGELVVMPTQQTTYILVVTGALGDSDSAMLTVDVVP